MTPKEKAKELVDKFYYTKASYPEKSICYFEYSNAIKCALICVDWSIESLWRVGHSFCNEEIKYLEEVKQEIIKL